MRRVMGAGVAALTAICLLAASAAEGHDEGAGLMVQYDVYKAPPEPKPRPSLSPQAVTERASIKNFEVVGQVPLTWPGSGAQIALRGNYAYVGLQPPAIGTDVIDISDPTKPRRVGHVKPPGSGVISHKVRICGDVMVTNAERNRFDDPKTWQGGLVVWSLSDPVRPKRIAFLKTPGEGVHRIFYDCDTQRVYMNANDDGFVDKIEWVVDMSDPYNPRRISRLWYPGQKNGEPRSWTPAHPVRSFTPDLSIRVHNVIPDGDRLYAAWWDAGLTVWDISDIENPKLMGAGSTAPPDQGAMHSAYPLKGVPIVVTSDEWVWICPEGYVRIWNVADPTRPLQISTFQLPEQKRCETKGPQNIPLTLNSAHSFAEPPTLKEQDWPVHLIFATWFGRGLRVIDVSDPYLPVEVGHFLPQPWPGAWDFMNKRSVFYASDVTIDWKRRLVFLTDRADQGGAGLFILKWTGDDQPKPINYIQQ
jgi:hypothetical protein